MNKCLTLFLTFFRIGIFTFGGGYAMIGIIEDICVERKKWISHEDMMNITVIAESTPGPIAINCATFVGYKQAGVMGAVVATFGVVLPSFVLIFLISKYLVHFMDMPVVSGAFQGIKAGVGIIIVNAAINMIKKMKDKKKKIPQVIIWCSFGIMLVVNIFSWNVSTISLMLTAAVVGLGIFLIKEADKGGKGR
ncbi:MAG: chromate transporter [Lachnospiraceae bacterium]|nr:chromate transporter [Lachnospiraceae bacterium]